MPAVSTSFVLSERLTPQPWMLGDMSCDPQIRNTMLDNMLIPKCDPHIPPTSHSAIPWNSPGFGDPSHLLSQNATGVKDSVMFSERGCGNHLRQSCPMNSYSLGARLRRVHPLDSERLRDRPSEPYWSYCGNCLEDSSTSILQLIPPILILPSSYELTIITT